VREVVAGDARDLFATVPRLNTEPKRNLLLGGLCLVDKRCDLVVLIALSEPVSLPVSFGIVVESHSRLNEVTLLKTM
jgi:hypothetical protein